MLGELAVLAQTSYLVLRGGGKGEDGRRGKVIGRGGKVAKGWGHEGIKGDGKGEVREEKAGGDQKEGVSKGVRAGEEERRVEKGKGNFTHSSFANFRAMQ